MVELDDVALFKAGHALHRDAALEAGGNLAGVVFEASERLHWRLEDEVARLRQAEGSMTEEAYRAALEALLLALAETGAEIRALEAEP